MSSDADQSTHEVGAFRPTLPPPPERPQPANFGVPSDGAAPVPGTDAFVRALNASSLQAEADSKKQRKRQRRKRFSFGRYMMFRLVLTGIVIAVGAGVAGARQLVSHGKTTDPYPEQWDARVTKYADFVEDERGLTFVHPVHVDFLTQDEFVDLFRTEDGGAQADETDVAADLANATGLGSSSDPLADREAVAQVTTLGFYSPDIDRIVVRGDDLNPAVQAVLVHELTHALQHQHFDVHTGGPDDLEVRSIVEADAMRIEDAYMATLGESERGAAIAQTTDDGSVTAALTDVPWAVVDKSQAPYILGPIFLDHVIATGGDAAVDEVFLDIPTSRELIDPAQYGTSVDVTPGGLAPPADVTVVNPQAVWSKYDALVMLDAWLLWRESRTALDGWVAAEQLAYTHPGTTDVCFSASVQFNTADQAAAYAVALTAWAAASGSATVPSVVGVTTQFEACPRPVGAADPPKPPLLTSEELYVEQAIVHEIDAPGLITSGDPWYTCVARAMVDNPLFSTVAFTQTITPEQQAGISAALDTAHWVCGPPPVA